MIVYRMAKKAFMDDLSGQGARMYGGRWNSAGNAILYTASTASLCVLEVAVHCPLFIMPKDYHLITLYVPDDFGIYELPVNKIKSDWKSLPHTANTQQLGDDFLALNQYPCMKVPSATAIGDFNILINPHWSRISAIKIIDKTPFEFDSRLFFHQKQKA